MNPDVFDDALILTGPTASGKSAVGLLLAERLGAEIVSMDSMAIYRGMDIGTAKPLPEERARVPHHLVDLLDPAEPASLAWWLERAAECSRAIRARGKRVLFVGGTPLYLKGLLRGIFEGPPAQESLRKDLEALGGAALHARLQASDPITAARLHPNDLRRLVRALEVQALTGRPISFWQQQFERVRPRKFAPLWLDLPRPVLYDRINERVLTMMARGLLDEVRGLLAAPRPLSKESRQALGYKELIAHLEGRMDLSQAVAEIQTRSRNFAKRQITWFRHLEECRPLNVAKEDAPQAIAERALLHWGLDR